MNEKAKIQSMSDLMWTVEDESVDTEGRDTVSLSANCGGCSGCSSCCVACCCDIPNIFTKFICN